MIIGLCDAGFPSINGVLRAELPDEQIVVLAEAAPPVDVLVPLGATVDAELMDTWAPRLIQQFGVGLQGVDLAAAGERGIPVSNLPASETGNAVAVSEVVLLHLLALLRRYPQGREAIGNRLVGQPAGNMLAGKTVAVVGLGAIGTEVLRRLAAFRATPLGVGRRASAEEHGLEAGLLAAGDYYRVDALPEALGRAQAVVLCCPLTEETRGLIGERELAAMPDGGYLVNVGRGQVVDYDALLGALRGKRLSGAGLDVYWSEPIDPADPLLAENVSLTPHIGGVTEESYAAMASAFAANVERLRQGEPLVNRAT
jgi:phosphoglycerate dehydrogenase-like enzyme